MNTSNAIQNNVAPGASPVFRSLFKLMRFIDDISVWSGKITAIVIFPMIASLIYEVISRYFFNLPTIWARDVTTYLYGAHFMLGAAFCLQRQLHIRTDFLYEKWSNRTKGLVDATLYILLYFPGLMIFLLFGWEFAAQSVSQMERTMASPWMPYIWPLKLCIPIATILLLFQGISELIKCFYAIQTNIDVREDLKEEVET